MSELQRFEALKARSQMIIGGSRVIDEAIRALNQTISHARQQIAEGGRKYRNFEETSEYQRLAKLIVETEAKREVKQSERQKIMEESDALNQLVSNCAAYLQEREIKARAETLGRTIEESFDSKKRAANTGPTWTAPGSVFAQRI
jgi:hypothetical protein